MILALLVFIPLLAGLILFMMKEEAWVRPVAMFTSLISLALAIYAISLPDHAASLQFDMKWLPGIGSTISMDMDGMSKILCLLTALAYPVIFLGTWHTKYSKANNFFALMLLTQAGLMGVFVAVDALLFYFFWELALIPVYFLCSQWGGEKRIAVTFKFFVYTFLGSILMLIGILYVYTHTPDRSFSLEAFYNNKLDYKDQTIVFWLFFAAFAIKMPVFPFHTWQPDAYEQSPTATTMVLSGIMVKMGVFGLLRWLLPVVPLSAYSWGDTVSWLSIIGMLYASLIAIRQDDMKRLVAYSSIAHIGLMCLAVFAENETSIQGTMLQMFNHGINIIGLWIVVDIIEKRTGTRKMSELGGLAQSSPALAILFVIMLLANVSLPLTNSFIGEFLMFSGVLSSPLSKYSVVFMSLAGICIILVAVYMLSMMRKVFYGSSVPKVVGAIGLYEKVALISIAILIFWTGLYPKALLDLTVDTTHFILSKIDVIDLIKK